MRKETELIELYCAICAHYDISLVSSAQRLSNNNCPKFTDEECITTYLWGLHNQKFEVKACYKFIKDYYEDWFPAMPSYQAYNSRICYLSDTFKELAHLLLCGIGLDAAHKDFVADSMPIVVAGGKRSGRAKTASDLCAKGYCASKDMWYYGVKLHTLAQCNYKSLPTPAMMTVSTAAEHDLPIAKNMFAEAHNITVFCDTAFADKEWQKQMLSENNIHILTPIKLKKGQKKLPFWDRIYSAGISSVKQVIESFNNWIAEKTHIQRASKVRSASGLVAFIFARIACACWWF